MNLLQFRARVSGAIGISNIDSSTEQALVDGWVNEGVVDFLRKTKMHKRLLTMTFTADEAEYTLDTDILSLDAAWVDSANDSDSRTLEQVYPADLFRMQMFPAETTGPRYLALMGAHLLMVHPAPSTSADSLRAVYVPRPEALATTASTPSATANGGIPPEWHPVIESYAKWKAADYIDDASSQNGMLYMQEYQAGVLDAIKSTNMKAGGRLPPVIPGGRRRWPSSPGVDTGY